MNRRAQAALLPDGRRLHLQDGPIDLIIEAFALDLQVGAAYAAAKERFLTILDELCAELPLLRQAANACGPQPTGVVAKRMLTAVLPYAADTFITPMAAVAGSVAEEILAAMTGAAHLDRAYVNNGGDIALHIGPGEAFLIGRVDRPDRPSLCGTVRLRPTDRVRGIATSGWRGRSFSLGIADAVTVVAESASAADAAATIIANAVDLPAHPAIDRAPACELVPDTDLGSRLVTQNVGPLSESEIELALSRGSIVGRSLVARRLILGAALNLCGETRVVGSWQLQSARMGGLIHA
jgi:ApbE superfamily uncharacterized protein (UPF0280 family)